jgi:hypothetical protein
LQGSDRTVDVTEGGGDPGRIHIEHPRQRCRSEPVAADRSGTHGSQRRCRVSQGALRLSEHAMQQDRGMAGPAVVQGGAGALCRTIGVTRHVLRCRQRGDRLRSKGVVGRPALQDLPAEIDDVVGQVRMSECPQRPAQPVGAFRRLVVCDGVRDCFGDVVERRDEVTECGLPPRGVAS